MHDLFPTGGCWSHPCCRCLDTTCPAPETIPFTQTRPGTTNLSPDSQTFFSSKIGSLIRARFKTVHPGTVPPWLAAEELPCNHLTRSVVLCPTDFLLQRTTLRGWSSICPGGTAFVSVPFDTSRTTACGPCPRPPTARPPTCPAPWTTAMWTLRSWSECFP